jgi:hypothetical protein
MATNPRATRRRTRNFVRSDSGRCLHCYFDFMDDDLSRVYLRACRPGRRSVGNSTANWLARWLTAEGNDFTMADNAFLRIDWPRKGNCRRLLGRPAGCPTRPLRRAMSTVFEHVCHWSLMQVEYPNRPGVPLRGYPRPAVRAINLTKSHCPLALACATFCR